MTATSLGDPLVGRVLDGRYEILSRLARGGMATVYRAHDRRLTRTVAVKVMHDGLGDDAEFARKFDREARCAATLSNPHVVSVFDQGVDDGRPYIVMEFVTGCTLRHIITREAPIPPLRALEMMESVASALSSAHEAGLVHRDVKPENVLISERGQVKVADFGLARAVSNHTATATQGLLIGTVSYLPPELVTSGRADARSDVYSAGVVLFELLTGKKPHTGETPIQVAYSHVHSDIPAPSTLLAGNDPRSMDSRRIIPPYLDALVVACTRREPSERPKDGRALLQLIRTAKKALGHGILDDPALTDQMNACVIAGQQAQAEREALRLASSAHGATAASVYSPADAATITQPAVVDGPAPTAAAVPVAPAAPSVRHVAPTPPVQRVIAPTPGRPPVIDTRAEDHRRVMRRRRGLVVTLMTLLLALLLALGGYWWFDQGRYEATPSLTQLPQAQAAQVAQANGLVFTAHQEYSETIAKGVVIRTAPSAGEKVLKDTSVEAWVSQGPERHAMPKVEQLTKDEAAKALQAATLAVGTITERWSDRTPTGKVIEASQESGAQLKRATAVDLVVSKGPRPVDVSDFTGQGFETARKALQKVGLKVAITEQFDDKLAKNLVIQQSPAKGQAHKGDTVKLVVSKGPDVVAVPNVAGQSEAQASAALKALGFKVNVNHATPGWLRDDKVQAVDPGVGKSLKRGATVTIWVI